MAYHQQGNQGNPGNPADSGNLDGIGNPASAQAAIAAGLVLSGQLVLLPVFDRDRGFVNWLKTIKNAQHT